MKYYPHFLGQKKRVWKGLVIGSKPSRALRIKQEWVRLPALPLLVCGFICKMSVTSTFRIVAGSSQIMCLINR